MYIYIYIYIYVYIYTCIYIYVCIFPIKTLDLESVRGETGEHNIIRAAIPGRHRFSLAQAWVLGRPLRTETQRDLIGKIIPQEHTSMMIGCEW